MAFRSYFSYTPVYTTGFLSNYPEFVYVAPYQWNSQNTAPIHDAIQEMGCKLIKSSIVIINIMLCYHTFQSEDTCIH